MRTLTSHSVENDTMSSSTNPPVNAVHYSRYRVQVGRLSSQPSKKMCVQELPPKKGKREHRFSACQCAVPHTTHTTPTKKQRQTNNNKMELTVRTFGKRQYAIEVGEDDTTEKLREKVASATGLCEDDFHMEFGGEEVEDITQLSAGDTVVLTEAKAKKYEAIAALHALHHSRKVAGGDGCGGGHLAAAGRSCDCDSRLLLPIQCSHVH